MHELIYLDNNSTTPVDERVFEEMIPFFNIYYANSSSLHSMGQFVSKAVSKAREQVATLINALENNIIFTSGATEAINLAMKGLALSDGNEKKHIVTVTTEHKSVLSTAKYLESVGFRVTYLEVDSEGLIDLNELRVSITDDTLFVAIMFVNNETGVIQQIQKISELAHEKGVLFFCDGTQAVGKCPIDVSKYDIDMLSFSAHKFYGPKGIGALYINWRKIDKWKFQKLIHGGTEKDIRSGTLNSPGIIGLGKACEIAEKEMEIDNKRICYMRDQLEKELLNYPGSFVNGSNKYRLYNTTNICFPNLESNIFIAQNRYIAVSNSSACSSALEEPSHVLKAMGLSNSMAMNSIRFSFGKTNSNLDIIQLGKTILNNMLK